MTRHRIIIIGGGNMGTAVLQAMLRLPNVSARQVTIVERNRQKRRALASKFSINAVSDLLPSTLARSTVVLLAVKPQDFPAVAVQIRNHFSKTGLLVSIMAGVRVATLRAATGCSHVVRVMPNLPMVVGHGCSAWYAARAATRAQKIFTRSLFSAGGEELEVRNEAMFDAITAVSGSGPAYLFAFAADLMSAAKHLGLSTEVARRLILQTLKGSVALLAASSDSADQWRERVTSKGGTTEAAFRVLHKAHLDKLWLRALRAAAQRSHMISLFIDKEFRK